MTFDMTLDNARTESKGHPFYNISHKDFQGEILESIMEAGVEEFVSQTPNVHYVNI
jgi:hypothetical protein